MQIENSGEVYDDTCGGVGVHLVLCERIHGGPEGQSVTPRKAAVLGEWRELPECWHNSNVSAMPDKIAQLQHLQEPASC